MRGENTLSWVEYDAIETIWLQLRERWRSLEEHLPNWGADGIAFAQYQAAVMEFGALLEKQYELEGTAVIEALEQHCENLYHWMEASGAEKVSWRDRMQEDFALVTDRLARYCEPDTLACCAILKDEGEYIREWIEYHRLVGVNKFLLYDNDSTDGLKDILRPYIEEGIVLYTWWPGESKQFDAYNDALVRYKNRVGYIAFIDGDEFLVPVEDRPLPEVVREIFSQDMRAGGVGVNWRMYGSSNYVAKPEGLVIENYVYRALDSSQYNRHVKSIVNPRRALGFVGNPHSASLREGYYCISENGTIFGGPFFGDGACAKLRVNHYHTRSKEEFIRKIRRGWPDQPYFEASEEQIEYIFQKKDKESNVMEDRIMDRYVARLKEKLGDQNE